MPARGILRLAGIDVSKAHPDVAILPDATTVQIANDAEVAERRRLPQSVPGVGPVLSAGPPELGVLGAGPIASLAVVGPIHATPAPSMGRGRFGGRRTICNVLDHVAVTAARGNRVVREHSAQVRARRPHTVVLIACARWLLTIMAVMLRDGLAWRESKVSQHGYYAATVFRMDLPMVIRDRAGWHGALGRPRAITEDRPYEQVAAFRRGRPMGAPGDMARPMKNDVRGSGKRRWSRRCEIRAVALRM